MVKNKHKNKKPKVNKSLINKGKQPKVHDPDGFHRLQPVWKFSSIDLMCPDWGWSKQDQKTFFSIINFLKDAEQSTWGELIIQTRKTAKKNKSKHHAVSIARLSTEAQQRLEDLYTDNLPSDELFSFHVAGSLRLWGFRSNNIYNILWCDPNHSVYQVNKS